eukprot:1149349-Pelagomonas_calceolata.AAC.4
MNPQQSRTVRSPTAVSSPEVLDLHQLKVEDLLLASLYATYKHTITALIKGPQALHSRKERELNQKARCLKLFAGVAKFGHGISQVLRQPWAWHSYIWPCLHQQELHHLASTDHARDGAARVRLFAGKSNPEFQKLKLGISWYAPAAPGLTDHDGAEPLLP